MKDLRWSVETPAAWITVGTNLIFLFITYQDNFTGGEVWRIVNNVGAVKVHVTQIISYCQRRRNANVNKRNDFHDWEIDKI